MDYNRIFGFLFSILLLCVFYAIDDIFKKKRNNKIIWNLRKLFIIIFWILAVFVTALCYWAGIGYLANKENKVGLALVFLGVLLTLGLINKIVDEYKIFFRK